MKDSPTSITMLFNSSDRRTLPGSESLPNLTCHSDHRVSVIFPVIFMTVGITSNSLATGILIKAYQRFRKKSKASFLLFASGLVITDLFGHLINGAIAVFVYANNRDWIRINQSNILCSIFGMCMVFFGLCPLLLGSVMAIERCIGVTKPIFHSTKMTSKHVKVLLALVGLFALLIASLPILSLRTYEVQASRTWCFLKTEQVKEWADRCYLLLFSGLGMLSLSTSFICNAVTGLTLIRVKIKNKQNRQGRSHHFEMIIQLLAIMCVSCICWSPFLLTLTNIGIYGNNSKETCKTVLYALRMATWNQILDPWVYILLRKAVLKKLYGIARSFCGGKVINLPSWELSSIKNSLKVSAISESPVSPKANKMSLTKTFSADTNLELK
ncbi:prostaglandin F2-alpha receptor [Ambystoma mexicanum]|uniref:prostaglandin F2-alpha receptor n=1 Tax=Ambystoma mexicanum TaxID=8296 RepID=UPI0037E83875